MNGKFFNFGFLTISFIDGVSNRDISTSPVFSLKALINNKKDDYWTKVVEHNSKIHDLEQKDHINNKKLS